MVQNRETVAELIIDDELLPVPACPDCGAVFPQRFIHLFTDIAECPVCQRSFRLSHLVKTPSTSGVATVPPAGIMLSEQANGWTLVASNRSIGKALETWIFSVVWFAGLILMRAAGAGFGWYFLLAFLPLWVAKAALQTWGHYVISVQGSTGTVFTGVGEAGWRRRFSWEALRTVSLKRERAGRTGIRNMIVLDSDRKIRFGEELSDEQREFVAALLVARR